MKRKLKKALVLIYGLKIRASRSIDHENPIFHHQNPSYIHHERSRMNHLNAKYELSKVHHKGDVIKKNRVHTLALLIGLLGLTLSAQAQDTHLTANFKEGYSGEQGKNNWSYEYVLKDGSYKKIETFDSEKKVWKDPKGTWKVGAVWGMVLIPGHQNDVALTWTSPSDGKLTMWPTVIRAHGDTKDGVQVCIKFNDQVVWPKDGGFHLFKAKGESVKPDKIDLEAKAGDKIHFIVNRVGKSAGDSVAWNPYLTFKP